MAIDVNWVTGVITIPKADMPVVQVSPELRELDIPQFHRDLRAIHASVQGAPYSTTHRHNGEVVLSGITYPRSMEILAPYSVEFEEVGGNYGVLGVDANSNILDVKVANTVSYQGNNSGGPLQKTDNALRYAGSVYIDVANGQAGTAFPIGTEDNPSNNLADSLTIAAANNLRRFYLRGSITLTATLDDWTVIGNGEEAEVNLNGQDVADTEFRNLSLTGTMSNGPVRLFDCDINAVDGFYGSATTCALQAGAIVLAGDASFFRCASGVPGTGTPIIDMDSLAVGCELRAYAGGLQINNLANASATLSVDFVSGQIVIDSSCTNMQSGRIGGTARYENNSSLAFNLDGLVNFDMIWRGFDIPPSGNIT